MAQKEQWGRSGGMWMEGLLAPQHFSFYRTDAIYVGDNVINKLVDPVDPAEVQHFSQMSNSL